MNYHSVALQLSFWLAGLSIILGATIPTTVAPVAAAEMETSKEIIAVQIRKQGFPCDNPKSAERDPKASKPDEDAWILQCENAAYRVRLIPDMDAHVERIN